MKMRVNHSIDSSMGFKGKEEDQTKMLSEIFRGIFVNISVKNWWIMMGL